MSVDSKNFPQEKSIRGIGLPFVIYSNTKLFLLQKDKWWTRPRKPEGEQKRGIKVCSWWECLLFARLVLSASLGFCSSPSQRWISRSSLMPSLVIPLCLCRISIWGSLCFCTSARPRRLSSGPISVSREIPPLSRPLPRDETLSPTQALIINMSIREQIAAGCMCRCMPALLRFFVCGFYVIRFLRCACIGLKRRTTDWNNAQRPVPRSRTSLLHHFQTWISPHCFSSAALLVYELLQESPARWNDLVPSHDFWLKRRIQITLLLFKHRSCSTTCMVRKTRPSIPACSIWI